MAGRASLLLSRQQLDNLARYLDLLLAGNESMNLTRITDRHAAEVQHVAQDFFDPRGVALTILGNLDGFKIGRDDLVC